MKRNTLLTCLLAAGCAALTGCSDEEFDMKDVDALMGFGGGEITLPTGSSTAKIQLNDMLDIDGSDLVSVDDDGNYLFSQKGDAMEPGHPQVSSLVIRQDQAASTRLVLDLPAFGDMGITWPVTLPEAVTYEETVETFDYTASVPHDIVTLSRADVNSSFTLTLNFSEGLAQAVASIDCATLQFPPFFELANVRVSDGTIGYDPTTGIITLTNLGTSGSVSITADVTGIKDIAGQRQSEQNYLVIEDRQIKLKGCVDLAVTISEIAGPTTGAGEFSISSQFDMEDFEIVSATGRFCPDIDLADKATIHINSVPRFLKEEGVVADLHNPQIRLEVSNDLDIAAIMQGTLVARDAAGTELARALIKDIRINGNGLTKALVCQHADLVSGEGWDQVVEVEELAALLHTIPATIDFTAEAVADTERTGTVTLGTTYTVAPSYDFIAPLAFGPEALIVYSDTLNAWNDDIEELQLSKDARVTVEAEVENSVPAYLTFDAQAIDKQGNIMSEDRIKIEVDGSAIASADGAQTTTSRLTIVITQTDEDAFRDLDGIVYRVNCAASHAGEPTMTGVTLNERTQTIQLKNIKVTLAGTVIADLN